MCLYWKKMHNVDHFNAQVNFRYFPALKLFLDSEKALTRECKISQAAFFERQIFDKNDKYLIHFYSIWKYKVFVQYLVEFKAKGVFTLWIYLFITRKNFYHFIWQKSSYSGNQSKEKLYCIPYFQNLLILKLKYPAYVTRRWHNILQFYSA